MRKEVKEAHSTAMEFGNHGIPETESSAGVSAGILRLQLQPPATITAGPRRPIMSTHQMLCRAFDLSPFDHALPKVPAETPAVRKSHEILYQAC